MLIMFMISCRKPYNPPAITAPGSYLVVEGVINAGADSTNIKLSKTVNLSGTVTANPILGAALTVESNHNNIYPLTVNAAPRIGFAVTVPERLTVLLSFILVESA